MLKWRGKMVEKLSKRQERKKSISKKLSSKSPILAHIIVFSKYYYIWDKKWIFYDQIRALKSAALKHTFEFLLNVLRGRGGQKKSHFCLLCLICLPMKGGGRVKISKNRAYVVYERSLTILFFRKFKKRPYKTMKKLRNHDCKNLDP